MLSRCAAPGSYAYTPTTPQREQLRIRDQDDLQANLPLGAAALRSQLARAGVLEVDLHVVGTYEADAAPPAASELEGDCAWATHVVVGLTTGAFELHAGGSADVGAGAGRGDVGVGASSRSSRDLLSGAGDPAACAAAGPSDVAPPYGCGALLRVEVARLEVPGRRREADPDVREPTAPARADPEPVAPRRPAADPPRAPAADRAPVEPPPPTSSSSSEGWATGLVIGGLLVTALALGAVLAAVQPEDRDPVVAPAGLGRAAVSVPTGAAWTLTSLASRPCRDGVARLVLWAAIVTAAGTAGCGEGDVKPLPLTLRVAVSTDLDVPAELDGLAITVTRGGAEVFARSYDAEVVAALPDSLLLDNAERSDDTGDPILSPIEIRVVGTLGGEPVVERLARVTFQNDEAKLLRMPLCEACVGVTCATDETCIRGACTSTRVDVDALPADGDGVRLEGECAAD